MKYFHSKIIITFLACTFLFAACTTSPTPSPQNRTANTVDDLDAILEEAVLTLSTNVSDIISSINNMETPKGTERDRYSQYLEWENKLDQLDYRIDELEDTLESNMRTSNLSSETYYKLYKELHALEELVDSAENKLEQTFQIYD